MPLGHLCQPGPRERSPTYPTQSGTRLHELTESDGLHESPSDRADHVSPRRRAPR